jgi:hypothetical protein
MGKVGEHGVNLRQSEAIKDTLRRVVSGDLECSAVKLMYKTFRGVAKHKIPSKTYSPRHGMVLPSQRFCQEALCRRCIAFGREEEVEGRAGRIHRTIQISATCP